MSGANVSHYLNGTPNGSGTIAVTMTDTDNPLFIGSRADFVTAFRGQIDAVRIYNRALTPTDVTELYQSVVPEPGALAALSVGCVLIAARHRHRPCPTN
jgi:hypothetical protein